MEENRKGPGIFYAVVGVATLVVAIIGATFAYFSASASNNTAITGGTAAAGGISLDITNITHTEVNMIPLNVILNETAGKDTVDQFGPAINGGCKDANGNNVCNIYSIKVTNNSTTSAVQVRGTLTLANTGENMYWKLLTNDTIATPAAFTTNVKQGITGDVTVGGNTGSTGAAAASQNLGFTAANNSATYYVLVWLEETGKSQDQADASKSFTGTVTFDAVDAGGHVSGVTAAFGTNS